MRSNETEVAVEDVPCVDDDDDDDDDDDSSSLTKAVGGDGGMIFFLVSLTFFARLAAVDLATRVGWAGKCTTGTIESTYVFGG